MNTSNIKLTARHLVSAGLIAMLAVSIYVVIAGAGSIDVGAFSFLDQRSGFEISDQAVDFHTPNRSFWSALAAGILNTIKAFITGAILATIFGFLLFYALGSRNVLASNMARIFSDVVNHTSLVIQILFWYFIIALRLPSLTIDNGPIRISISNRGLALPWLDSNERLWIWLLFNAALVCLGVAWFVIFRHRGNPFYWTHKTCYPFIGVVTLAALGSYFVLQFPFTYLGLEESDFGPNRGLILTAEFTALMLMLMTAGGVSFAGLLATVRGAYSKGELETAGTLGFSTYHVWRYLVLPRAFHDFRSVVRDHYIAIAKTTALGSVIAFPELVSVSETIRVQSGQLIPMFFVVLFSYFILSGAIYAIFSLGLGVLNANNSPVLRSSEMES